MARPVTVQLDDATIEHLDRLAKVTGRSREWLTKEAVLDYLALNAWQLEKIAAGIEAADRGHFASDAEIERILRKYDPNT
jgi:predicted transcriptional regulator